MATNIAREQARLLAGQQHVRKVYLVILKATKELEFEMRGKQGMILKNEEYLLEVTSFNYVDECANGAHKCHKDASCTNTLGSYSCKCKDNKPGNGFICNEPAAFKDSPATKRILTFETVSLSCSYYNSSLVTFKWIKDYNVLDAKEYTMHVERKRDTADTDIMTHGLTFNATVTKQGRYWCQIKENIVIDSGKATVILKDSSATEIKMEVSKVFSIEFNKTSSLEHKQLKGSITDAMKAFMTGRKIKRRRRSIVLSDVIVALNDIQRSGPSLIKLDVMVYYEQVTNEKRLAVCKAMQKMTRDSLSTKTLKIFVQANNTYDCCYSSLTGDPDIKGVFNWSTQVINEKSIVKCPATNTNQSATRECVSNDFDQSPSWALPFTDNCLYIREATQKLSDLTKIDIKNSTTAVKIVKELEEVTRNQTNIKTFVDVALAVDVIANVAETQSNNTEAFDGIVNVTNSLMSADTAIVEDAQRRSNASEKLVKAVERFADNIPLPENQTTQTFSKKNLAIGVTEVKKEQEKDLETNGFIIIGNIDERKTSVEMKEKKDTQPKSLSKVVNFELPGPLFAKVKKEKEDASLRVITLLYDNAKLFLSQEISGPNSTKRMNSRVLAVSIKGIKLENLTEEARVRSQFRELTETRNGAPVCVFWEESQREWSTRGCRYEGISNTDSKVQKCSCNHLTNFAVLLDVTQKPTALLPELKDMMEYFTYIGCGLSIAGLVITAITIIFCKNLRQKNPQRIIVGICISLILALVAFLVGTQHTSRFDKRNDQLSPISPIICFISSVATHYFVLCSFMWMVMQSYYLYLSCVRVMGIHQHYLITKMVAFSFGLPLIVVAIVIGIDNKAIQDYTKQKEMYLNSTSKMLMNSNSYVYILDERNRVCMINGNWFYGAYLAPIGLMILVNFTLFIFSIRGIFGSAQKTRSKGMSKKRKARIILSCVVIMGLTWIIGVFAIGPLKVTLQVVFTVFNSLQGVFIFVFYCLLNKKVQTEWRRCLCGDTREDTRSSQSNRKSTSKITIKSFKKRLSISTKEQSSTTGQSELKQSYTYMRSLVALQQEFSNESYRKDSVFLNSQEREMKGSFNGPAAGLEEDDKKNRKIRRRPELETSI